MVEVAILALTVMFILVPPHSAGADFRNFYAPGWLFRHGQSPYSMRIESYAFYHWTNPPTGQIPNAFPFLPWVALLAAPFTYIPDAVAFVIWDFLSLTVITGASLYWLRTLGWSWRPAVAGSLLVGVSTVACYVYVLGQLPGLAFGLFVAALGLAYRGRYVLSGVAVMMVALLYYQLYWPAAILLPIYAGSWGKRATSRVLIGEGAAALLLTTTPLLANSGLMRDWLFSVIAFAGKDVGTNSMIGVVGLLGFLGPRVTNSAPLVHVSVVASAAIGLAGIGYVLRRTWALPREAQIVWGLGLIVVIWATTSPYGHIQDLMLGFPLCLAMVGRNWSGLRDWLAWAGLLSLTVVPMLTIFTTSYMFVEPNSVPLGMLGLSLAGLIGLRRFLAPSGAVILGR
ncbi:MAG: hypothetical protein ACYDEA_04310 [Candidatus Dormibacteria bacterium]